MRYARETCKIKKGYNIIRVSKDENSWTLMVTTLDNNFRHVNETFNLPPDEKFPWNKDDECWKIEELTEDEAFLEMV